jgi:hypothetical protein
LLLSLNWLVFTGEISIKVNTIWLLDYVGIRLVSFWYECANSDVPLLARLYIPSWLWYKCANLYVSLQSWILESQWSAWQKGPSFFLISWITFVSSRILNSLSVLGCFQLCLYWIFLHHTFSFNVEVISFEWRGVHIEAWWCGKYSEMLGSCLSCAK